MAGFPGISDSIRPQARRLKSFAKHSVWAFYLTLPLLQGAVWLEPRPVAQWRTPSSPPTGWRGIRHTAVSGKTSLPLPPSRNDLPRFHGRSAVARAGFVALQRDRTGGQQGPIAAQHLPLTLLLPLPPCHARAMAKPSRPAYRPTMMQRRHVEWLAPLGGSAAAIAMSMRMSPGTVRRIFGRQFAAAMAASRPWSYAAAPRCDAAGRAQPCCGPDSGPHRRKQPWQANCCYINRNASRNLLQCKAIFASRNYNFGGLYFNC